MSAESERWSEWMRRAQNGDEAAYRLLIDELYEATTAYLKSVLFDAQWVEDCVQDCLFTLHRARASYDPRRPFNPWYFTIVRHRARDVMRRRRPPASGDAADLPDTASNDATKVEAQNDLAHLLEQLPRAYREALVMTKLEGMTNGEVAEKVGVATGTMKARVHRGLSRLMRIVHADWTRP